MGQIIRPRAFSGAKKRSMPAPIIPCQVSAANCARRLDADFVDGFDRDFIALFVALGALACIFALAGAAFAVRAFLVLCFATLAGRGRRVGVPALAETGRRSALV
jgi:hypothetical protein